MNVCASDSQFVLMLHRPLSAVVVIGAGASWDLDFNPTSLNISPTSFRNRHVWHVEQQYIQNTNICVVLGEQLFVPRAPRMHLTQTHVVSCRGGAFFFAVAGVLVASSACAP